MALRRHRIRAVDIAVIALMWLPWLYAAGCLAFWGISLRPQELAPLQGLRLNVSLVLLGIVVAGVSSAAWSWMFIHCVLSDLEARAKALWVAAILVTGPVGASAYYLRFARGRPRVQKAEDRMREYLRQLRGEEAVGEAKEEREADP